MHDIIYPKFAHQVNPFCKRDTIVKNTIFLSVPPVIIDEKTSTDLVVREASNVTLVCKASGYPEPYVMWRREDGDDFSYNGENGTYPSLNIILFL